MKNFLLTKQAESNIIGSMYYYHDFMKCSVIVLILLYALAGGHGLCAYLHCSYPSSHSNRHCGDSHHQEDESSCCSGDPCHGKHHCDGNDQSPVIVRRGTWDSANPLTVPFVDFVALGVIEPPPGNVSFREAVPVGHSALPVRLHLLYRSLLI